MRTAIEWTATVTVLLGLGLLIGAACVGWPASAQPVDPPLDCASSISRAPDGTVTGPDVTGSCLGQSSIGGTLVPYGLRCQEDEVIAFVGIDALGCRHVEGDVLDHLEW